MEFTFPKYSNAPAGSRQIDEGFGIALLCAFELSLPVFCIAFRYD